MRIVEQIKMLNAFDISMGDKYQVMATVGFDLLAYATLLLKEEDRIHPQGEEDDDSFESSIINKRQKDPELSDMKKKIMMIFMVKYVCLRSGQLFGVLRRWIA